jgi:hypothetical protein
MIISLVLIALLHYLYHFFKNTLTIPKIRDLVVKPNESYNEIMSTIQQNAPIQRNTIPYNNIQDNSMKDELKNFLNEITKPKNNDLPLNNIFESANNTTFGSVYI